MNTAANFLSRTGIIPTKKLEMNLRNETQTKAIEVNIQSSGIAEAEQTYFLFGDETDEKTNWDQIDTVRINHKQNNELENEVTELQHFHKPTAVTVNYREGHFRDNAKIRLEQNNDPVLQTLRAEIEGEQFEETAFTGVNRYPHYLRNMLCLKIRQDISAQKYYNDTGQISHYQIILPKQLLDESLIALHGNNANRPDTTKLIQEAR